MQVVGSTNKRLSRYQLLLPIILKSFQIYFRFDIESFCIRRKGIDKHQHYNWHSVWHSNIDVPFSNQLLLA